jgi:hypothetical protein
MLTLEAHGIFLRGHIEAAEMPLYPATAFVMNEVFIPNGDLRLLWRSAKPGRILVASQRLHRVEPYAPEFTAERECRDISLGAVSIDNAAIDAALGTRVERAPPRPPWPWLRSGKVPVSAVPDDDLVATVDVLEPRDDTVVVEPPRVLSVSKGYTRVVLSAFGGVLFGWVPSNRLTTSRLEYLDLSHDAFSLLGPPQSRPGNFMSCDHDVPLVAEIGGDRRLVGTIRRDAQLERLRVVAGWCQIDFRNTGIASVSGASFWVRESDILGCHG